VNELTSFEGSYVHLPSSFMSTCTVVFQKVSLK
jgi:hypothetical protein